ncbi:hypothetical protein HELRODRAFT_111638 [Helobdella robusta]|uniref:SANT domain-containing protein n=1 Tax=Helobdella robusta TaxID=6412 RepID=T1EFD1_HELRO|nr:hypothetical protein HELRODRAFT_111638 [Helobdella robusta]ESO04616.1 hypothetical protein HELRODRAFT_111638 [Helobdella robusta]
MESHAFMKKPGSNIYYRPLYHQPSDVNIYHENIKKFVAFKPQLISYIKKKKHLENSRDRYLCRMYDKLSDSWFKRLEKIESNPKKKVKDAKVREIFEKVFPDLRKKREDKERLARSTVTNISNKSSSSNNNNNNNSDNTNGDNEIVDEELRKRREMSSRIPMLLYKGHYQRLRPFISNNGYIDVNTESNLLPLATRCNYWTQSERDIFKERYASHPKNFAYIASHLETKSIQDCVLFYYASKKNENYKQLVRKHHMSRRKTDKAKKVGRMIDRLVD